MKVECMVWFSLVNFDPIVNDTDLSINPLMPTVAVWVQLHYIEHPVRDRVKPPFVIFDIWAL